MPGRDRRFAPSPTGPLHLGSLRTALLAWLFARWAGARFLLTIEDLDANRVRPGLAEAQLADLAALGLGWDGAVVAHSQRLALHEEALPALERAERAAAGRPPALRLRAEGAHVAFVDRLLGPVEGVVDDLVVRRNDGAPAYNLAVVVDDADQGVGEVVRGADLADSTPRQLLLAERLRLPAPAFAHVPLVLGPETANGWPSATER